MNKINDILKNPEIKYFLYEKVSDKIKKELGKIESFPSDSQIKAIEYHFFSTKKFKKTIEYARKQKDKAEKSRKERGNVNFWKVYIELFDLRKDKYFYKELYNILEKNNFLGKSTKENNNLINDLINKIAPSIILDFSTNARYYSKMLKIK